MSVGNEGRALLVCDGRDGPRGSGRCSLEVSAVEAEVIAQLLSAWVEGLVARDAIRFDRHGMVPFNWLVGWLVDSSEPLRNAVAVAAR